MAKYGKGPAEPVYLVDSPPDSAGADATVVIAAGDKVIGATKDAGPNWETSWGVGSDAFQSADATTPVAVTDAPASGQKLVIDDVFVSVDTDMKVELEEETSGDVLWALHMGANSYTQFTPRGKMQLSVADKKLFVDTDAAGNISVTISYHSET